MRRNRNNSKKWTERQDRIAKSMWLNTKIKSLILGRSENAISHRLYNLSKKVVSKRIEQPVDYPTAEIQ